jgi:hypothetical protein
MSPSAVLLFPVSDPSPTPFPDYTGDPNLITPGVAGFIAILVVAIVTILLLIKLEEEQAAADAAASAAARKTNRGKPKALDDGTAAPKWGG